MDLKENRGITLTILIITIIIMLILIGISIGNVVENEVITKTEDTVNYYNNRVNKIQEDEEKILIENTLEFKVKD